MYRYTTPTIRCTLNGIDFSVVQFVRIAIKGNRTLIVRQIPVSEIDTETGLATIRLTQEETAKIGYSDSEIEIQGRVKYADGTVQPTTRVRSSLYDVLDKVVI